MGHYLVTGCAGFIASKVCAMLVSGSSTVVGIDNFNEAYDRRLKDWRLSKLQALEGFHFQHLDITDRDGLACLADGQIGGFDAVINLAARAGVRQSVTNPWTYLETNVTGTLNLLEFCRTRGVGKFVLASSSSLYGLHNPRPFSENTITDKPLSPYAASKKAAEEFCYAHHHLHGLDTTVLRFFTVYGPAGRPDMSPFRFVQWVREGRKVAVFGDGTQERDFTYVDDIARGAIAALKPVGFEIINLGSDQPVQLNKLLATIQEVIGKEAYIEHQPAHCADMKATWANVQKAAELLDWHPEVGLRQGVERLVEWYEENRSWAREIATG